MVIRKTTFALIAIIILAAVLRFYRLGSNPPSPYWEEAAIGYDAYSILKTGKDFHGNPWPLVAFESFGDYKPSLYFYATVPSVALFGLNTFSVRFASAFFGTLTVALLYWLLKDKRLGLAAAFLLAISPWHLQLSRAGFEANLGLFFVLLGLLLVIKQVHFALSALPWILAMYTYHADRVLVPLLLLGLWLLYRSKKIFLTGLLVLLLSLPLFLKLNSPEIKQRFRETSAFATLEPIIKSNQLISEDGNTRWAKLLHHRFWQYGQIFLTNYLDHFNLDFLFLKGDTNPRHSIQTVGSFYLIQLPLLLLGLSYWLKSKDKKFTWLLGLLILAPVPAALAQAAPHALRSLALVIPLTVFSAFGLVQLKRPLLILVLLFLSLEFGRYLYLYYQDYPQRYAFFWQSGYREMVEQVNEVKDNYEQIYFTRQLGRPSIYYWFYSQTDPREVQSLNTTVLKDQGEYLEFNKLIFGSAPDPLPSHSLVVTGPDEFYENP